MNSSFPNRWSFSYLKFTKYVTNIIAEPKYKYGQQEQVTVRNHDRSKHWKVIAIIVIMKPATYQKGAGGNLESSCYNSPGEVDWQIKDTLQLVFQGLFIDLTNFEQN